MSYLVIAQLYFYVIECYGMNKCVFLDRDGVINKDRVNYAYDLEHFIIIDGVIESLKALKNAGYRLIVVTNQSGIAKGIYTREQMRACHDYLQQACGNIIDHIYYSPCHPSISESLTRKPDSLMLEKGIARFQADIDSSWLIGDKGRDIVPARKMGLKTIQVDGHDDGIATHVAADLKAATSLILAGQ